MNTLNDNTTINPIDKKFWNSKTTTLVPYVAGEQPKYRCIKLNTNENPYPPSPAVNEALASFDISLLRKYPDPDSTALRQSLSNYFDIASDRIFIGNGSDEVLALAFQAFFDKNRPIAFADITYSFYPIYAENYNIPYTIIKLNEDFTLPLEAFAAFEGGIIIANPNAPTGIYTGVEEIRRLLLANLNRLVILDEAYIDFGGTSAVPLLREFDNLLVVQTTSKSRSLAGLRIGYALGSPSLIKALECVRDSFNSYTTDAIAQRLATAAFEDDEWFDNTCAAIIKTRQEMVDRLKQYGFKTLPSTANFIFTLHPDYEASKLYEALKEKGIIVRYFNKPRISNYLRITVGKPDEAEILCNALRELTITPKE